MIIEGVVSRVRYHHGKREYTLTDGNADYQFYCEESLQQGACVILDGDMGQGKMAAHKVTALSEERAARTIEEVKARISAGAKLPEGPSLLRDDLTDRMWPALRKVSLELIIAKRLGRSVLLRFHGDADGVCGAFALIGIVQCKAFQQNSAMYTARDALRDISAIGQEGMPIVVLLDFGSADGCREGLELLLAAGMEYLVIDHHPYNRKGDARITSPFAFGEDVSRYTAGYIACEIAAACGLDKARALELARIACSGDKSDILQSGPDDARKAMVLDFLASHVSFGNNLDFYKRVMEKPELFSSIAQQADETIEDAASRAIARMKRSNEVGLDVAVFQLEGIVKKGEWPPSSKVTTRVFDKLKAEAPIFCVGYTERSVIMRLNDKAAERGLSANGLAEALKRSMADFVEGGGGHVKAGAIRAKKGFVKDVVNELLREAMRTYSEARAQKD